MPVEFIYFDIGNVLLTFDHRRACDQMSALCGVAAQRLYDIVFDGGLKWKYEAGELSREQYYRQLFEQAEMEHDIEQLDQAGSAIFELNAPMLPVVAKLEDAGYRLGVLSNICPSHWAYVCSGLYSLFPRAFEKHALSFEIGAIKPDRKVFKAAAELAGVSPPHIFYMDDVPANVEAAKSAGFDAVHYTTAPALVRDLHARGVRFNY